MLGLRHPNIVQIIGGAWDKRDTNVCLVLEYPRAARSPTC